MNATSFSIALAFLRIPRLFFALLIVPVILAVTVLGFQLLGSLVLVEIVANPSSKKPVAQDEKTAVRPNVGRLLLYGSSAPLQSLKVCRWIEVTNSRGAVVEVPPDDTCAPSRLDVAIHATSPATFDTTPFLEIFTGNVPRLHICKACAPDVSLDIASDGSVTTSVQSVWGMMVVGLANFSSVLEEQRVKIVESRARVESKLGEVVLYVHGLTEPVVIKRLIPRLALVGNVGGIVLVALWLALKAHRKILNLFSKSGSLLPLVAGLGKREFYGSLWWITFLRVGGFLLGAVPLTLVTFRVMSSEGFSLRLPSSYLMLWIGALVMSFSFATVLTSIADLKERHGFRSVLYLWMPLLVCAFGVLVWGSTFLFDSQAMGIVRSILTALPIVGMGPLLLAPAFPPYEIVLIVHGALAAMIVRFFSSRNAEWLAAHLEEV